MSVLLISMVEVDGSTNRDRGVRFAFQTGESIYRVFVSRIALEYLAESGTGPLPAIPSTASMALFRQHQKTILDVAVSIAPPLSDERFEVTPNVLAEAVERAKRDGDPQRASKGTEQ